MPAFDSMLSTEAIIERLMHLRTTGKIIRITPYTAGLIETALRAAVAPSQSRRHPADALNFRFDGWDKAGVGIVQTHAFIGDWEVAKVAWEALKLQKPNEHLTWRSGMMVHAEQPWTDQFAKRA